MVLPLVLNEGQEHNPAPVGRRMREPVGIRVARQLLRLGPVPPRRQGDRELGERAAGDGQTIQPSLTVDQEIAAIAGPVGSLKAAIGTIYGLDPAGRNVDGLQQAADRRILRKQSCRETNREDQGTLSRSVTSSARCVR